MKRQFFPFLSVACLLTLAVLPAASQTPIIDFTGSATNTGSSFHSSNGYDLRVGNGSMLTVSGLGAFDQTAHPASLPAQVGLWNSTGSQLLASATITSLNDIAVTSTSSAGHWLETGITPITLGAGSYVLGEYDGSSFAYLFNQTASAASGITIGDPRYSGTNSLSFPNNVFAPDVAGEFGPTVFGTTTSSATPEPGTLALLATGGLGGASLLIRGRWRAQGGSERYSEAREQLAE